MLALSHRGPPRTDKNDKNIGYRERKKKQKKSKIAMKDRNEIKKERRIDNSFAVVTHYLI